MKKERKQAGSIRRSSAELLEPSEELEVKIMPWGPHQSVLDRVSRAVIKHPSVKKFLEDARYRLLTTEWVEFARDAKPIRVPGPARHYRTTFYDYTKNRTILVDGSLDDLQRVEISESGEQPLPNREEFDNAVNILLADPEYGPRIREQDLQLRLPPPPLVQEELPDGRVERTLRIALLDRERLVELVGVNLIRDVVVRLHDGIPNDDCAVTCGPPWLDSGTSKLSGQVQVTVTQGGVTLWKFIAVRPGASSGTNGSGVELRYVDYRGKRVLYRAHVPILNVKYDDDACGCGPYRDWQYQETFFEANGTDVGSTGFRVCPNPAQTILDTGTDAGNFRGVAVYVQGQEVVLVSEMLAGWYRYISEWRLHADGTIRPRFGFTAVQYKCVCHRHHHHVYWRLDFDIRTAGTNVVHEYNDPPIIGNSNWHTKYYEIKRPRDPAHNRKWRIENAATGEAYELIPGATDGVATLSPDWDFPRGDVWILKYHGNEIDDGVIAIGPPYEADILNTWQSNFEPIQNQDVVIWYAAHFTHVFRQQGGHIVGPEIRVVKW